jgi:hypothetical protein
MILTLLVYVEALSVCASLLKMSRETDDDRVSCEEVALLDDDFWRRKR